MALTTSLEASSQKPVANLPTMPNRDTNASGVLTGKMLKFIAAWQGSAIAAAQAAGYSNPKAAASRLMSMPVIRREIRRKQKAMTEESGKLLGSQLNFTRSHVLNRLWEIAQMSPDETNNSVGAQVRASEALATLFDAETDRIAEIVEKLQGMTEQEVESLAADGNFPESAGGPK
jgi:phage terminase small subunit